MSDTRDLNIRVGGAAGDGIATLGESFARLFTRNGYHAYGHTAYQSVIRGGHVWFHSRGSPDRVGSPGDGIDILYAYNEQTAEIHIPHLRKGGVVIHDPEKFSISPDRLPPGTRAIPVPTLVMSRKFASDPILSGSAGMGACTYLSGLPFETLVSILTDNFGTKSKQILEQNIGTAEAGFKYVQEREKPLERALSPKHGKEKLLLTGNEAIAMGAAAGGCNFLAQYPMTPASSIMHWMAAHAQELGVVVKQAEDELAAINMAIGASHTGVRAMTATSGGGFSLMVEALGMAGMSETPLVVVNSQRTGPSTGLPTKTEQGDLDLMLGAGQGDFPRVILAPGDVVEAYHQTREAFRLAEEWQTPILVASDFNLSENFQSADREDFPMDYEPPNLYARQLPASNGEYRRYAYTPTGVSPRAFPGQPGYNYVAGSDEHDETGHLISDVKVGTPPAILERKHMMEKRMRKLEGLRQKLPLPTLEGPADAALTIVAWGSTAGPVRDALKNLEGNDQKVNFLHINCPYPLRNSELASTLLRAKKTLLVEANYTAKLGGLIRRETGFDFPDKFLKYDGEPFYPEEIVTKALEVLNGGGH